MHQSPAGNVKVAVVSPLAVKHDAISLAAYDTVRAFGSDPRFEVIHLGCVSDYPDMPHRSCSDVAELMLAPEYQAADAAIFGFGIHHSLFDAFLAGGPRIRVARFHNVTPAKFVALRDRQVIERSLQQIELLRYADEVWADSLCNANELLSRGFDPSRIRVIPLVVESPRPARLEEKRSQPTEVLFVGRIASSKGVHDLIGAVAQAGISRDVMHVTVAGNTAWSDPEYLARVRHLITANGLEDVISFVANVDDSTLERLYHAAHIVVIPSYHEGFCRPVAEGLRAGCIPVVYDAFNLPFIAARLGIVVPVGDVEALSKALVSLIVALPDAADHPSVPLLPLDRGATSVQDFDYLARDRSALYSFRGVSFQMRQRLLRLRYSKR